MEVVERLLGVEISAGFGELEYLPEQSVEGQIEMLPLRQAHLRRGSQNSLLRRADFPVQARQYPVWRALEDGEMLCDCRDFRNELHRAGGGADHAYALPGEIDAVIPIRRMERRTGEAAPARDIRELRAVELPERRHQSAGLAHFAGRGCNPPQRARIVPPRGGNALPKPQMRSQTAEIGHVLGVALYLGGAGKKMAPVQRPCERKLIERHRCVAGTSR